MIIAMLVGAGGRDAELQHAPRPPERGRAAAEAGGGRLPARSRRDI